MSTLEKKNTPTLISGVAFTELEVYSQRAAPDGLFSGCPHVHGVCDEAYLVQEGEGWVELHDLDSGYRKVPLKPGDYLHFPPQVVHRLATNGQLRILAFLGNAGLAEAGDARIYFGEEIDGDAASYEKASRLNPALGIESALDRRDLAVRGYMSLLKQFHDEPESYRKNLTAFLQRHLERCREKKDQFKGAIERGPIHWGRESLCRLENLKLDEGVKSVLLHEGARQEAFGMCGVLRPYLNPKSLG